MFPSDLDIIKGCIKLDIKAQEALFKKYGPELKKLCFRYCRSADDAQDVFQDSFIKIYKDLHTFRNQCPLIGWMKKIAVNTVLSFYRKKSKTNTFSFSEVFKSTEINSENEDSDKIVLMDEADLTYEATSQYEAALLQLSYEQLLSIISALDPPQNIIFNMFYIENFSHREIANTLDISENNCRILLHRAKKKLKESIKLLIHHTQVNVL